MRHPLVFMCWRWHELSDAQLRLFVSLSLPSMLWMKSRPYVCSIEGVKVMDCRGSEVARSACVPQPQRSERLLLLRLNMLNNIVVISIIYNFISSIWQ